MTISNRETCRDALTALLLAGLVGTGKPASKVYGYKAGDFGGESPVVSVASAGSEREQRAITSRQKNKFNLLIYTFTLYSQASTGWGEDDAEDRVDLLEKTITEIIAANQSTSVWAFIERDGKSVVDDVIIAGEEYIRETIPIEITIYDN